MINLLPTEIREAHRAKKLVGKVITAYIVVLVLIIAGIAGLFIYNISLSANESNTQGEIDALKAQKTASSDLTTKAAFIEDRIASAPADTDQVKWNQVLTQISNATPVNLQLTSLKVAVSKDQGSVVTIAGTAPDRRTVILFNDKLSQNSAFIAPTLQSIDQAKVGSNTGFTFTLAFTYKTTGGTQ